MNHLDGCHEWADQRAFPAEQPVSLIHKHRTQALSPSHKAVAHSLHDDALESFLPGQVLRKDSFNLFHPMLHLCLKLIPIRASCIAIIR